MASFLALAIPLILVASILFSIPSNLEAENAKRAAKGKPAFSEREYQQFISRSRLLCVIIVVVALIVGFAMHIT